tara:strand:- start:342 stop:1349 length:1008 start_codon:yes stop_codon:yes gene_type:complete
MVKIVFEDDSVKPDTDDGVEVNEVDRNAMGGTELMKYGLYERLDVDLLNKFQIIPSRVREIDEDRKNVLWLHDLPWDPESQHLKNGGWDKFDKLVFVSNWQMQAYNSFSGVPYSAGTVLRNAIEPLPKVDKPNPEDGINIIYHTTPHRGLEILVPVFVELAKADKKLTLDVFSSFEAYGWPQRDEPYEELFQICRDHPQINYHGYQPNSVVREALTKAHIFAYPCIWPETSCISLMEAMSAGCFCVHPNLAALPETSALWTYMYQFHENHQDHANVFGGALQSVISLLKDLPFYENLKSRLSMQKQYADAFYSWETRAHEWTGVLTSLLDEEVNE